MCSGRCGRFDVVKSFGCKPLDYICELNSFHQDDDKTKAVLPLGTRLFMDVPVLTTLGVANTDGLRFSI